MQKNKPEPGSLEQIAATYRRQCGVGVGLAPLSQVVNLTTPEQDLASLRATQAAHAPPAAPSTADQCQAWVEARAGYLAQYTGLRPLPPGAPVPAGGLPTGDQPVDPAVAGIVAHLQRLGKLGRGQTRDEQITQGVGLSRLK